MPGLLWAAGAAALVVVQIILARYVPGYGFSGVLSDMLPPSMLAALVAVGAAATAVVVTLVSGRPVAEREPTGGRVDLLLLLGVIGGGFGVFAAAWSALATAREPAGGRRQLRGGGAGVCGDRDVSSDRAAVGGGGVHVSRGAVALSKSCF